MKEWGILHSHDHRIYESSCTPPAAESPFITMRFPQRIILSFCTAPHEIADYKDLRYKPNL